VLFRSAILKNGDIDDYYVVTVFKGQAPNLKSAKNLLGLSLFTIHNNIAIRPSQT